VVSDAKIFKPVSRIVRTVSGGSPKLYADAIVELLTNPQERARLENAATEWAKEHSYPLAVQKLLSHPNLQVNTYE
jgi:hypothetical protein